MLRDLFTFIFFCDQFLLCLEAHTCALTHTHTNTDFYVVWVLQKDFAYWSRKQENRSNICLIFFCSNSHLLEDYTEENPEKITFYPVEMVLSTMVACAHLHIEFEPTPYTKPSLQLFHAENLLVSYICPLSDSTFYRRHP